MRPALAVLRLQATPEAADESDDGVSVTISSEAIDQTLSLLGWLANFALNLVWAGVLIVAVVWVSGRLRRRLRGVLERRVRGRNNLPALLDNIIQIGVYVIAGAFALSALGANSSALVTTIGLITAAVSLSLQDVLRNFVAGLYLLAEQPFAIGDRLEVAGQVGTVEQINVRTTVLRNDKAEQVLVPNYQVFSQIVSNRTAYRLTTLTVQVAGITGDPDDAVAAAEAELTDLDGATSPPTVQLTKLVPDGCDLSVTVWTAPGHDLRRTVLQRLRARFPDATISVP